MKYSVTTVCLPEMDMVEQCAFLQRLGYDGMELRCRRMTAEQREKAIPNCWGYHRNDVSPENLREKAADIKKILSDHGLSVAGLATNMTCADIEQFKHALEGAVELGSPFIRLGASAGFRGVDGENYKVIYGETLAGYARCIELAKGTGSKMILETHGNTIHSSMTLAHRIVSNFTPSEAGVIFDPQNMVRDGFETVALVVPFLGDYIAHCHFGAHRPFADGVDEATGTVKWKWEGCRLSEGLFHFPTAMEWLKKINYKGYITIEDFRSNATNEEKFSDAIQYLKKLD